MVKKEYQNCFISIITFDSDVITSSTPEVDPFVGDRDWSQYSWWDE